MKVSHVHCRVRDLPVAVRWFEQVWLVVPVIHSEQMAWLGFGEFGVLLDARLQIAWSHLASTVRIAMQTTVRSRAAARRRSRRRKIGRGAHAPPISRDRAG
jgi:hypothetical protein